MDQSCYADPQMFGGRIRTPTLERLAKNGLTYTNFNVNAAVLADPRLAADRAQQPSEQHGDVTWARARPIRATPASGR